MAGCQIQLLRRRVPAAFSCLTLAVGDLSEGKGLRLTAPKALRLLRLRPLR